MKLKLKLMMMMILNYKGHVQVEDEILPRSPAWCLLPTITLLVLLVVP